MKILQSIKLAWRSINSKKARSVLTVLSIFIGIASVMAIVSVMEGMKDFTRKQYAAMGSNKITVNIYSWAYDEEGNNLSKDYYPELQSFCAAFPQYIEGVTPNGRSNATVVYGTKNSDNMEYQYDENWNQTSGPPTVYYGSELFSAVNNLQLASGRDLCYMDQQTYNQVVVIGSKTAEIFFGKLNPIGKVMQLNGQNFTVVGTYASRASNDQQAFSLDCIMVVPYTTRRVLGDQVTTEYYIKAKDSDSINQVITRVGGFLKGLVPTNNGGYNVYSESSWQESENEYMTMIGLVLGGIAAISLLVGGIGIMNIMLVTVTERTREIGIRRAVGATRKDIILQFLIEAGMICGLGGILGIVVGSGLSFVLGKLIFKTVIYPLPWVTLSAFALSVALGMIFGCYPAIKASRLQPVEALRAE